MKKYLRHITYLTLCLFLMNSGLSVAAGYGVGQATDDGRVLICTSTGVKWVSLEAFDEDSDSTYIQKTLHDCPLCCAGNGFNDHAWLSSAWPLRFTLSDCSNTTRLITDTICLSHYDTSQRQPRAPPFI